MLETRKRRGGGQSLAEGSRRTPLALLIALCLGALVFCLPTLRSLGSAWSANQYHAHVAVMGLIASSLAYSGRERISTALRAARPPKLGFLLVLIAAGFQFLMYIGDVSWLAGVGIAVLLATIAYSIGGASLLRALAAPLAFVALMAPPGFLFNSLCDQIFRPAVSQLAAGWLELSGVAVAVEGHHLELPSQRLVVVLSCCGLPPMLSLGVIAILLGISRLRRVLRSCVLVASVVPLVVAVNVVRVVVAASFIDVLGPRNAQRLLAMAFDLPTLLVGTPLLVGLARVLRPRGRPAP